MPVAIGLLALIVATLGILLPSMIGARGSGPVPAQLSPSTARLAFRPGTTIRAQVHHLEAATKSAPQNSEPSRSDAVLTEALRVISIDSQGNATIGLKVESASGLDLDPAGVPEVTLVISPDGRILSGGSDGAVGSIALGSVPGSDQFASFLPNHTVRPGESWHNVYDRLNPFGAGILHVSATTTFVRYRTLDGRPTADFHTVADVPIDLRYNLRAISGSNFSADATVGFKGTLAQTLDSTIDLGSHDLVESTSSDDFDLDVAYQNAPISLESPAANYHYSGHRQETLKVLSTTASDLTV